MSAPVKITTSTNHRLAARLVSSHAGQREEEGSSGGPRLVLTRVRRSRWTSVPGWFFKGGGRRRQDVCDAVYVADDGGAFPTPWIHHRGALNHQTHPAPPPAPPPGPPAAAPAPPAATAPAAGRRRSPSSRAGRCWTGCGQAGCPGCRPALGTVSASGRFWGWKGDGGR